MSEFGMSRAELNVGLFAKRSSSYFLVTENNEGMLSFVKKLYWDFEDETNPLFKIMLTTEYIEEAYRLESGSPVFEIIQEQDPTLLLYKVNSTHKYEFISDWSDLIEEGKA